MPDRPFSPGDNPLGIDGVEFIEFAAPDPALLGALFEQIGFTAVARHRSKEVVLYRQGEINFLINAEPDALEESFTQRPAEPLIYAVALRVKNAAEALRQAISLGAWEVQTRPSAMELNIPGIHGIGDSLIYFVDRYGERSIYDVDFVPIPGAQQRPVGLGLLAIDHLGYIVAHGRTQEWVDSCESLFNFREIANREIEAELSGLTSRVMASPCGKIHFVFNEPRDESEANRGLDSDRPEGIQHVALSTADAPACVERLTGRGARFANKSARRAVTEPLIGQFFFEIVQR
jgi:4-hydroxyphenylpyruvate dioxygenase